MIKLIFQDPVGHSLPLNVVPIKPEEIDQVNASPYWQKPLQPTDQVADTGLLACTYEPFIVGEHKIHVMYAGAEIPESPFVFESIPVGRADLCEVKGKQCQL